MFLPLGFGGRFPSIPWFTLLLSVALWLVHDSHGKKLMAAMDENHQNEVRKFMETPAAREAALQLCQNDLPSFVPQEDRAVIEGARPAACPGLIDPSKAPSEWGEKEETFFGYLLYLSTRKGLSINPEVDIAALQFKKNTANFVQDHGLLTKATLSLKAIVYSIFLHGDWWHLLGNLLFLLAVGCLIEIRRSSGVALAVFLVGGGVGALAHFAWVKDTGSTLVGASGGIFALAGLFTAYFWRFRMKFLFFIVPPFYRTFHANALLILPLSFFASELISGVSSVALGDSSGVAHWAHLGGFVLGLGVGLIQEKLNPIEWPFLYAGEKEKFDRVLSLSNPHERIHECNKLLKYNPENIYAVETILDDVLALLNQGHPATPELKETLRQHFPTLISVYQRRGMKDKAFRFVPKIPLSVSFMEILDRSSQSNIMSLIAWAERHNLPWTLLRAYDLWLTRFASNAKLTQSYATVESLLHSFPHDQKTMIRLDTFMRSSEHSPFFALYKSTLDELLGHRKIHHALSGSERKDAA